MCFLVLLYTDLVSGDKGGDNRTTPANRCTGSQDCSTASSSKTFQETTPSLKITTGSMNNITRTNNISANDTTVMTAIHIDVSNML